MTTKVWKFTDWFRKSNLSYPCIKDALLKVQIIKATESSKYAMVRTGFRGQVNFTKNEISLPNDPAQVGKVRTVQCLHVNNPFGEMDLSMKKVLDERRAGLLWQEIQAAAERSQPIMGRVLNAVNGGFAVGVGGYVAFLPT
eukprot:gene8016-9525_t